MLNKNKNLNLTHLLFIAMVTFTTASVSIANDEGTEKNKNQQALEQTEPAKNTSELDANKDSNQDIKNIETEETVEKQQDEKHTEGKCGN